MADYRAMYTKLFNAVTDSIKIFQTAQIETEEIFISQEERVISSVKSDDESSEEDVDEVTLT